MDSSVHLDHVMMKFDDFVAVQQTDLKIESGEFFSFLGPSGCGKTTLLNIISGFIEPTEGTVHIGGQDMRRVPANKRPTSMIFQNLALFPLMTVAENIEFGLEVRGVRKAERRKVSERLLNLVALPECRDKRISDLSGGQKQRIAIARALAVEPRVLLLDEPLSALDLKLRQHMRTELKDIQRKTGITFIYITHDQGEALTMSDRVAVMSAGKLQQVADPMTLYRAPATPFVASFVGENNRIEGKVVAIDGTQVTLDCGDLGRLSGHTQDSLNLGDSALLFIRPELLTRRTSMSDNCFMAQIRELNFEGAYLMIEATPLKSQQRLRIQLLSDLNLDDVATGNLIIFGFAAEDAMIMSGARDV
ncbi:ABC transporter ATP-binding protein [Nitrincola tibetensis]|uniref:ABC transporter ATP-binding protein n=1 Tax=Nitrincola tibetensis TaxID=2219697 RepID=A0A364NRX2_9GAMM|nr:ABC transporter ATP-binding protein [Nitrincola tibetensis]RAU19841.1 ABC transporter ATP-binding protein [Nitrincola tibetensis]